MAAYVLQFLSVSKFTFFLHYQPKSAVVKVKTDSSVVKWIQFTKLLIRGTCDKCMTTCSHCLPKTQISKWSFSFFSTVQCCSTNTLSDIHKVDMNFPHPPQNFNRVKSRAKSRTKLSLTCQVV